MFVLIYYTDSGEIRSKSELPPRRASEDALQSVSVSAVSIPEGCSSIVVTQDMYDGPDDMNNMEFSEMSVIDGVFSYTPTPKISYTPPDTTEEHIPGR